MLSNNNLRFIEGVLDIANNTNRALLFKASFIASFNGLFNGSNPRQSSYLSSPPLTSSPPPYPPEASLQTPDPPDSTKLRFHAPSAPDDRNAQSTESSAS